MKYFPYQSSKLSRERPVDVGAHWVGRTQHRVMELARQFGLGLRSQYLQGTKVMQVWAHSTHTGHSKTMMLSLGGRCGRQNI